MTNTYTPRAETIDGSDLSGSSGAANRTYTLANDDAVLAQMQVMRDSAILQSGVDFSFDEGSGILTFITNVWDDQDIAIDYLTDDTPATGYTYTPKDYSITGADLNGSDGATDRVFQFLRDGVISESMAVVKSSATLQNGVDYTFNTTTRAITFLVAVGDSETITIDFYIRSVITYATTLQAVQYSGLGIPKELENLGTGDSSEDSFDSKQPNIIEDSFTIYYGTSGDNKLLIMVEGTDYQINITDGRVFLLAAGVTKLSTDKLYISYTYSPKQSDAVLNSYLVKAAKEVEKTTGNYWGAVKSSVQYFDGYDSGYPQTDEPYGTQVESYPEFELFNKGVATITSVLFLDRQGSTDTTLDSTQYRIMTDDDDQESRVLVNTDIPNGKANIQITYTHGYSSVPELIQEIVALTAGLMGFINITGGSYDAITNYQLGRKSFTQGEQYVNIREVIVQLKKRIDDLTLDMGYRFGCA